MKLPLYGAILFLFKEWINEYVLQFLSQHENVRRCSSSLGASFEVMELEHHKPTAMLLDPSHLYQLENQDCQNLLFHLRSLQTLFTFLLSSTTGNTLLKHFSLSSVSSMDK